MKQMQMGNKKISQDTRCVSLKLLTRPSLGASCAQVAICPEWGFQENNLTNQNREPKQAEVFPIGGKQLLKNPHLHASLPGDPGLQPGPPA